MNDLNQRLQEISRQLYGEKLELRAVDPKSLVLLRKNARYMAKETFDQLTRNVQGDGALSSVPLCHTLKDGTLEVLSGNHRVKAAIQASLPTILVLVFPEQLQPGRKVAVQLSHNAIAGQDDQQLLTELWNEIDSIQEKLYSGLDSKAIGELTKIQFSGFGPAQIRTEQVVLWFLPDELKSFDQVLEAMSQLASAQTVYMAPLAKYDALFQLLVAKKKRDNIKNTSVAFMALIDELIAYEKHRAQQQPNPKPVESPESKPRAKKNKK